MIIHTQIIAELKIYLLPKFDTYVNKTISAIYMFILGTH